MKRIVIIGAGFAGMYSALSAARLRDLAEAEDVFEIVVVAPEAVLNVRPRLYEDNPLEMGASLSELFGVTGVRFVGGFVHRIDEAERTVSIEQGNGEPMTLPYDRLVLAAGSRVVHPPIPGLSDHAFSVDRRDEAHELWQHVQQLAARPASAERDTVVVVGGGFTGIETAAEMPNRMRSVLGEAANVRVIVVERADAIGPDLGPGPRPVIEEALGSLGVEWVLGKAAVAIDATGLTLEDGTHIPSATVIWTGGLRATPLTEQIEASRDALGRLIVERDLRVPGVSGIFASGDAASAATDQIGNRTLMACQHAIPLGRVAGHNAAADLLGRPTMPYSQEQYVTCLDLGPWGAVYCEGWDRQVVSSGAEPKKLKHQINSFYIYPPKAERDAAFAAAEPGQPVIA